MTDIATQSIAQPVFLVGGSAAAPGAPVPSGSGADPLTVTPTGVEYEFVAASASAQVLGTTGAVGDYLAELLIIPATTSPGAVTLQDGNGAAITIFAGGASSVSNLWPLAVGFGLKAVNATTPGWKVTTGASVSVLGIGDFS